MQIGDMCNREVVFVEKTESVLVAAKLMRERHVGDLVVIELRDGEQHPVGMLTDRDLVVSVLATDARDLERLLIQDVLTRAVVTVREADPMNEAIRLMRVHGVRRLPVVDADDHLVGLVAFDDVVEYLAELLGDLALISTAQRRREEKLRP
ncbi:MAG: CBS domain-containing protein [Nannocystis sp.]|jgi:CBS domain-containing protein|nr:CBS domain-containing protein [Nannocystis sp.]